MKRCMLDTNIITAFLKNDLGVVTKVSEYLDVFVIHLKDGREFVTDRLNALIKM